MPQQPDDQPENILLARLGRDRIRDLAARTAEMMYLPQETCPVRRCRRARACLRIGPARYLPVCVPTLPQEFTPCYSDYLGWAATLCADARDGEHGPLFELLNALTPRLRGNAAWIARQCLADDAAALACLDASLALIADADAAPPVFQTPDEENRQAMP